MEEQGILQDIFFVILYGGVIMLDTVAALYLLLRRANAIAPEVTSPIRLRRWAALFLIALALSHVFWILYALDPSPIKYLTVCGLDILLYIPTTAGILLSMLQDRHRPSWPVLVAMVPVILMVAIGIIRKDEGVQNPLFYYVLFLFVLLMLYMCLSVRRYGRWLKDNYADLEHKEIRLSFLILAVFLLFFLLYSSTTEAPFHLYLLQIDNILIVVLLLWRVESLQQLSDTPVQKTSAQPGIPSNIGPLLKTHCEDAQLYLQHDLTVSHLAQIIGTNRYYLSQYFAQKGITYNAYINGLRIRHFVRLYHEAVDNHRIVTAQQLAHESGFHSYSTFSATFKQDMGTTVTAWMRSVSD
jgi:AraC-like DNA-binding protein